MPLPDGNPKSIYGVQKKSLSLIPLVSLEETAAALKFGSGKYGAWNWRQHSVAASIYLDACMRHLKAWQEFEDADESGASHLGHAMASCAILLDAQANGQLIDDRPKVNRGPMPRIKVDNAC